MTAIPLSRHGMRWKPSLDKAMQPIQSQEERDTSDCNPINVTKNIRPARIGKQWPWTGVLINLLRHRTLDLSSSVQSRGMQRANYVRRVPSEMKWRPGIKPGRENASLHAKRNVRMGAMKCNTGDGRWNRPETLGREGEEQQIVQFQLASVVHANSLFADCEA